MISARTVLIAGWICVLPAAAATCESLGQLKLPDTTVASAQVVEAGDFKPPTGPLVKNLPPACRVTGSIHPTADSDIRFEVWMPVSGWNHRFQGVGNGGFAGSISYPGLGVPLRRGSAVGTTDTGHTGGDASWAPGHPEKVVDYGYRGIHEMTEKAKSIVEAFYGEAPRKSYFASCSNGGRQALMEAQRFPGDYDGIICGAPANNFTHIAAGFMWDEQALLMDPAAYIPPEKFKTIESAVVASCDAQDGVTDGIIADPRQCHFDPSTLVCTGADSNACLTQQQASALKKIYQGPPDAKGRPLFPGFVMGGEGGPSGWGAWIGGAAPEKSLQFFFGTQFFGNLVFEKPGWDYKAFDLEKDVKRADEKLARVLNATDPNLKPFAAHGGKLILYHGWCDAALTPLNTIEYYHRVISKAGASKAAKFVRLYMVPGMQHCGGGPGPDNFWGAGDEHSDASHDMNLAIERWVEQDAAPGAIIAAKLAAGRIVRTRPLCPYPQVASYKGSGSTDEAANFSCAAPASAR